MNSANQGTENPSENTPNGVPGLLPSSDEDEKQYATNEPNSSDDEFYDANSYSSEDRTDSGSDYSNRNGEPENEISSSEVEYDDDYDDEDCSESEESDVEDEHDYRVGGYHTTKIGERFDNGRYIVLQKLGWGHFSTVWLCYDFKKEHHCAVKVQKSDPSYTDAAWDEVTLLDVINTNKNGNTPVVELQDVFEHVGPNGRHVCLVFEVLSKSLLRLIKQANYKGIPLPFLKVISRQILLGLQFLHEKCHIIHTDIKPENILFALSQTEKQKLCSAAKESAEKILAAQALGMDNYQLDDNICQLDPGLAFSSGRTILVDYGNACWETRPFTDDIQTRQYRAPEVLLGCGYTSAVDIWSFACVVFELATGDFLFDPHTSEFYERDEDHLALMMELLGPVPPHIRAEGKLSKEFYNEQGDLRHVTKLNFWSLGDVLREKYKYHPDDAGELASFLLPMLFYDIERRPSATELLQHSFVNNEQTVEVTNMAMANLPLRDGDLGAQRVEGTKAPEEGPVRVDSSNSDAKTDMSGDTATAAARAANDAGGDGATIDHSDIDSNHSN